MIKFLVFIYVKMDYINTTYNGLSSNTGGPSVISNLSNGASTKKVEPHRVTYTTSMKINYD